MQYASSAHAAIACIGFGVYRGPPAAYSEDAYCAPGRCRIVSPGPGSTAFDAALAAQELGRTAVMTESRAIGGLHHSQMATPVGAWQGSPAARNALNGTAMKAFDGRVIPRAIVTDPPIGLVGMTEAEAIADGHRCWCATLPMELVPRAGAIRDTRGLIEMVADADSNEVRGVSVIGAGAAEVIHEAAMALRFRAKIEDFVDLLHIYPTMAAGLKIAAITRTKDPRKLSCCAE